MAVAKLKKLKNKLTSSTSKLAIIYGGNELGVQLAEQLTKLERDVVIIDEDPQQLKQIQEKIDVMTLAGSGVDIERLKQVGINRTELMLAVSDNDEKNVLTSIYANRLGVEQIITKVDDYDYLTDNNSLLNDELGIDLIVNPCRIVVDQITNLIRPTMKTGIESFISGKIKLSEMTVTHRSPLAFNRLSEIDLPTNSLVICILRRNRLFIPDGDHKIYPGDTVYILGKKGLRTRLGQFLNKSQRKKEKVVLAGGSNISYQLTKILNQKRTVLTLIEENRTCCEELAEEISDILVLNGRPTNIDLLKEEGIDQADIFVAAGNEDEKNLLTGLVAKKLGAKKVITIVNSLEYSYFSEIVNVDTILTPQILVLEKMLDFLHQGQVDTETILDGQMHLLKTDVPKRIANKQVKVKDLNKSSDLIVGIVNREEKLIIPDGGLELKQNDQLLVFTLAAKSNIKQELFSSF
ncbi:Trk system potassium transporter TrkA [Acetohalobium arabaticum]|uniref:Trk system potassium uptake protein TrkA n=1 Tax=Acetohalobium arabaticum (strain ATCC 49924 / DSM 5501 / Z-7288) TaxID=574087 RepID=D9QQS8_ACEAZ|nr:Trk system potassium transporter TrkA [Acetohalobium arabaticum]ADL12869.1 TrkA-N domain protein [Acetohalobium arabaticum DSM 5501]